MLASHGFPGSTRSRRHPTLRPFALALGLIALVAMALAPSAGARTAPVSTYLALGDSISFGYSEQVFDENAPNESPSYFEEGFTNVFAQDLARACGGRQGPHARQRRLPGRDLQRVDRRKPRSRRENLDGTGGTRSAGARRLPPVRVQQCRRFATAQLAQRRRAVDLTAGRRAQHPQRRPSGAPSRGDHAEHRLQRRARGDQAVRNRSHRRIHPHRQKQVRRYARSGGGRPA